MSLRLIFRHLTLILLSFCAVAPPAPAQTAATSDSKPWFERISVRGYTQLRYNRVGPSDRSLQADQDKSIGDNSSFFIRRARLILSGDVNEHVSFYLQPDFASSISGSGVNDANHFGQLRDLYADVAFDPQKEFRVRVGQSKVPFGFENLQSSQNRAPLDRADAMNTGVPNERDLGAFFYWTPPSAAARFKQLVDTGLKGSGNYGVAGIGIYNGQSANRSEANNNRHIVARVTYPWELWADGQIIETSLQGYSGHFVPTRSGSATGPREFNDWRFGPSLIVYPQPIGFQAEYNWGAGPELNETQATLNQSRLRGGYAMMNYKAKNFFPFARWQYYRGGRKIATNAAFARVHELELGLEWQVWKALELTGTYAFTDRTTTSGPFRNIKNDLVRFQLQFNY